MTNLPSQKMNSILQNKQAQWLSGRVLDSRPTGCGFEPHRRHCVVSLSKNINPSLVLVQPRKTCPFITERLLMGRKESNQTKNKTNCSAQCFLFLIVHCVPGRTELSGQCVLCDVGTYKEDAGNAACTNCSSIRTTAEKGSISQADCNIGESYKMINP